MSHTNEKKRLDRKIVRYLPQWLDESLRQHELPALTIPCVECRAEAGMPCRADDDPWRPRLTPHGVRARSAERPYAASA